MLLTAHGGALKTGRNTPAFFQKMIEYNADVIEVDIYKKGQLLYISHLPKLFVKRALSLEFVFGYIKENNFMVNCDLKTKGLVEPVLKLAKEMQVQDKIIFTGAVTKKDIEHLKSGQAYLNAGFFFPNKIKTTNLGCVKSTIDSLNNPRIKGINISYRYCSEQFLERAKDIGLELSLFTVDDICQLKRLMSHQEIANITTNIIDKAIEIKVTL